MGDFIRIERLVKRYRASDGTEVEALRDVSFGVERGEFVTLVGHSGCGKSTLLKILSGLAERSSGTVTVDGQVVNGPRPDVGIVFQKPLLLEWRRVLENVLLPVEIYGLDRRRYKQHAHRLLETAGLGEFLGKYPYELSGGMQQRVALCRALVAEPALLLMDEPFGSLDALTRQKMGFELLRLWQEWKSTVVFVTHDIVESIMLADRVVVMSPRPGRVIDVVPVDLPRPRDILMQDTPAFTRLASRIRRRLWEEDSDA